MSTMPKPKDEDKLKPVTLEEWKLYKTMFERLSGDIETLMHAMQTRNLDAIDIEYRASLQRAVEAISRFSPKLDDARIRLAKKN